MRTGVLKGVRPLHGVTGATRRREGAWPPSGSTEASSVRLRIPTPSANGCLLTGKSPHLFYYLRYRDGWDANGGFEGGAPPSWGDRSKAKARGGLAP